MLPILSADRQIAGVPEITFIDRQRLGDTPLFQHQRTKRVARRMHPGARLVVTKPVLGIDGLLQQVKGRFDLAGVVGHLARIIKSATVRTASAGLLKNA